MSIPPNESAEEFHFSECVQQAERVVNVIAVFHEVIPVVGLFQFGFGFLFGHSVLLTQFDDVFLEVAVKFFFGNAAYIGKSVVHGNVHQVVQVTEHADLAELGHSGEQGKLDVAVATLQYAVECFQRVSVVGKQLLVADGLKHGLVVFVDEDHYVSAGDGADFLNDIGESFFR